MSTRRFLLLAVLGSLLVATACFAAERLCYSPEEAADHTEKEICLSAHVYDIVENADGTRYLDVCKPEVPATSGESCRFTIVSLSADRKEVGSLEALRATDVHLRGTVHTLHGQSMMLLSNARQFHDGPEKFRPNPELLSGFGAANGATAFRDPAMSARKRKATSVFSGTTAAAR